MFVHTFASLLAALSLLTLAGCGAPHLRTVQAAERQLPGQDAAVLSRCIGEPMEVTDVGGESTTTSHRYSSAQARGADGLLLATPLPGTDANDRACVFDVTIRDGRVLTVDGENRAGWGFGRIKNCSAVVERCVSG